MWKVYALLSALFAALTAIFAKVGLKNVNPDLATAVRTVIILLITWSIVVLSGKSKDLFSFSKNNWVFLILSGVATGLSWLFYYRALQEGNAGAVNVIDKSSLLVVILLSFFFLNEPLSPKLVIASILIMSGMLLIVWK